MLSPFAGEPGRGGKLNLGGCKGEGRPMSHKCGYVFVSPEHAGERRPGAANRSRGASPVLAGATGSPMLRCVSLYMIPESGNPAPQSVPPDLPPPVLQAPGRGIAGFWYRVGAFLLDGLALGLFGFLLGLVFFEQFARLGSWGRLLGFGISLAYFGILNSRIGRGQSLGKRALNIEVVDRDGAHIGFGRSCLRYTVLGTPFFLNGVVSDPGTLGYTLGLVIFLGGTAILYLIVFNRRTRQSLHDLLCDTYVVKTGGGGAVLAPPVWRGHYVAVAVLCVVILGGTFAVVRLMDSPAFSGLFAVQQKIHATGVYVPASVMVGKSFSKSVGGNSSETHYVSVTVRMKRRPTNHIADATRVAAIVLSEFPTAREKDVIVVSIVYGYDIGIARSWLSQSFRYAPADWERMAAGSHQAGSCESPSDGRLTTRV